MRKNCNQCGKEYIAKTARSIYCSKECCREADKNRKKVNWDKKYGIGDTENCIACGKPFQKKNRNSVFCSRKCKNNNYSKHHPNYWQKFDKDKVIDKDITLKKVFDRDNGTCYLCGTKCDYSDFEIINNREICGKNYPSIDHVIPRAKGGLHSWENVRLSHLNCNCKKQDKEV